MNTIQQEKYEVKATGRPEVREIKAQYSTSGIQEAWEVWQGRYAEALRWGQVETFEPTEEGYRQACLASLRNDNQLIWAFLEKEIINKHPDNLPLIDRAIRAGFLIHRRAIRRQYNRRGQNQYVVAYVAPLDELREKDYIVTRHVEFGCTCRDWLEAARIDRCENYEPPVRVGWSPFPPGHAPRLEGIGRCCEHIIAVILYAKLKCYIAEEMDRIVERMIHPDGY